ncbi:MAG: flagellar hook-basal body protein [Bdellovibrionota bacterium]|jgi:flagellar basal-body rod protein FlgF
MDRGTYVAASGGILQFTRLDIANNNLANINTPGFKKQVLISKERTFEDTLASQVATDDPFAKGDHLRSPGVSEVGTYTDFSQGAIKETGNPFDVALNNPNDFFVIETEEGLQYTRAGNFTLNAEGALVTSDGYAVQGDGGALVANGTHAEITAAGVLMVDGSNAGRLQVARFEDPQVLEQQGGCRFKLRDGAEGGESVDAELTPQALEMSNVSAVSTMIEVLTTNRGFQLYEKTARTIDEMNNIAVQQIGRRSI